MSRLDLDCTRADQWCGWVPVLVKSALVGMALRGGVEDEWLIDRLGRRPNLLEGYRALGFNGAQYSAQKLSDFADDIDRLFLDTDASDTVFEAMSKADTDHLQSLARNVAGAAERGEFVVPAWLLRNRAYLDGKKLPVSIAAARTFHVDKTGVRWDLGYRPRSFAGRYTLYFDLHRPLEEFPRGEDNPLVVGDVGETWQHIRRMAYAHWVRFQEALSGTRVCAAMSFFGGRKQLRAAIWLSKPGEDHEYRHLQFAEHHPELAAQLLPTAREWRLWGSKDFLASWEMVSGNAKPVRICERTWLRGVYRKPSARGGGRQQAELRVLAQMLASGRIGLNEMLWHLDGECYFQVAHARDVISDWRETDPDGLRRLTWEHPDRFLRALYIAATLYSHAQWLPPWVIVRAMLASGLEAVLRGTDEDDAVAIGDCAMDVFNHSQWRKIHGASNLGPHTRNLLSKWLKLRLPDIPQGQRMQVAEQLPKAAERAAHLTRLPGPRWRHFLEWSRRWHLPAQLALARSIDSAKHSDPDSGEVLATPLVVEAGAGLPRCARRIETIDDLFTLAKEEEHCIATYGSLLLQGRYHCIVIETDSGGELLRSTLLVEERAQYTPTGFVLEASRPYRVAEVNMRCNATPPEEHRRIASEIVDQWCRYSLGWAIQSSAGETRRRLEAPSVFERETQAVDPVSAAEYWSEVSRKCVPPWLQELDPGEQLLEQLHIEQCRFAKL